MAAGQALLFAIYMLSLSVILAGALAAMWGAQTRTRSLSRDGLIAFYLAQAGIERAKIEGSSGANLWRSDLDISGDKYTFQYSYEISGNTFTATGQVLDLNNVVLGERKIQVNISSGAVIDYTWHEAI